MSNSLRLRSLLAMGVSAAAIMAVAAPAYAADETSGATTVGEVVVTAQRKEEVLQDVPIAVSAFSADSLKAQRIEGGSDLLQAIPNVNFARGNFGGYNFQIRGIGTKLVSSTGDAGVGVHENNIPLISNSLGDAEFFDVERVEVLRGPQGTLYGRNATGGVVNVIAARPNDQFSGSIAAEYGSFNNQRLKGFINLPLGDYFAVRAAGIVLKRDGYSENTFLHRDVDGRDLWSTRIGVAFTPSDKFRIDFMWERFREDDNRDRIGKQLCINDPGRTTIGGVATNAITKNLLSQGCLPGSLYGANQLGAANSGQSLTGLYGNALGLSSGDLNAGLVQSADFRTYQSPTEATYKSSGDLYEIKGDLQLTEGLNLQMQISKTSGDYYAGGDFTHTVPVGTFNAITIPGVITAGVINDPQVGTSNTQRAYDAQWSRTEQEAQEIRLSSSWDGPINFSVGVNRIVYNSKSDYFVFANSLNAVATLIGIPAALQDLSNPPRGGGHNYFDNRTYYSLNSKSVFGELYWDISENVRLTAGARYNVDRKVATTFNVPLLAGGSPGLTANPDQYVTYKEPTGRLNLEWTPELSFTNKTLLYASYSRGYKGGGFNPSSSVGVAGVAPTFQPEFVDAYEVGMKNTLLDGTLVLNATAFHYTYAGYQISKIINRNAVNENLAAKIYGAELEAIWQPVRNLRFNATAGYLHTEIDGGTSIDTTNLTQGDATLAVLKNLNVTNCVAKISDLAKVQTLINSGVLPAGSFPGPAVGFPSTNNSYFLSCAGLQIIASTPSLTNALLFANGGSGLSAGPATIVGEGRPVNLAGKELPNSPHYTLSMGGQYRFEAGASWTITPRIDYYWQDQSYARIFNTVQDTLDSYSITNLSLQFEQRDWGLNMQLYVRNVFDESAIQDASLGDASVGQPVNIQLTEPRLYGVSLTKSF